MDLPTEAIGSIPRPASLVEAYRAFGAGELTRAELDRQADEAAAAAVRPALAVWRRALNLRGHAAGGPQQRESPAQLYRPMYVKPHLSRLTLSVAKAVSADGEDGRIRRHAEFAVDEVSGKGQVLRLEATVGEEAPPPPLAAALFTPHLLQVGKYRWICGGDRRSRFRLDLLTIAVRFFGVATASSATSMFIFPA